MMGRVALMLMGALAFLTAWSLIGPAQPAAAEQGFNFKAYRPATIEQIKAEHMDHIAVALGDASKTVFEAGVFKYRVRGIFQGGQRRIRYAVRIRVNAWARSLNLGAEIADLFIQEIQLSENGTNHWIAVQKHLVPFLERDLARGDPIYLYLVFIGVYRTRPVFLANEFRKVPLE